MVKFYPSKNQIISILLIINCIFSINCTKSKREKNEFKRKSNRIVRIENGFNCPRDLENEHNAFDNNEQGLSLELFVCFIMLIFSWIVGSPDQN